MAHRTATPWGLTRMKPFPQEPRLPEPTIVLDAATQTGRYVDAHGILAPLLDRHKKSGTNTETKPKTSLDGNTDEGSDQQSDTD
ncbi:putative ATP-grasp-modified RiPP [Streptomyces sp. V2]|uniref:putative ATP-grasp-modified RiPP n=1 Tax=Streptomyces TaxID=1883 RepID=UPI0006EB5437|nr:MULTISPECIES: putative ATP-grasp-modified RiPP [Streptomyces]PWG10264.1 putative ATP-grasp-modified RiPP [Streptomyces sp. V2]